MTSIKGNRDSDEAGFKRLVELEAEYRTQRSAEQLHAIASFPRLFDDFPYPVLISAAILKLADYYRQSNNIQRHAILQVIKKSQPHLKSISNVDETIKRITPVLKSNDQLARAITLRVFGCMATIAYDRIDVYHNVMNSLDSSEAMEVSAAIYAADRMCAHSQRFCAIISGKLAFMVRDAKTPLPMKRRLIRIFGHMFEDIALARLARKTCLDILDMNQDGEYTVAILRTLTRLASHSLVDVNQQICLLLEMAQTHLLQGIRRVSLICLGSLAQKQIDFSPDQIKAIFEIATTSTDEKSTLRATCTLHNIFRFTSVMPLIYTNLQSGSKTMTEFVQLSMQVLRRFTGSSQPSTSASGSTTTSQLVLLECYSLLSIVLSNFRDLELEMTEEVANTQMGSVYSDSVRDVTQSMERFLDGIWTRSRAGSVATEIHDQSRTVLWLLITLTLEEGSGVEALLTVLLNWLSQHREQAPILGKALLKLAEQQPASVHTQLETLMSMLGDLVDSPKTEVFIVIFRTILEALVLRRSKIDMAAREVFESRISGLLEQFGAVDISERPTRNHWELYQLATFSLQAGWPTLAVLAMRNLEKPIQSAPFALWLSNVQTVALIESSLQSMVDRDGTSQSVDLYLKQQMYSKVVASLEEIEAYQFDRTFQLKLCTLRREYLEACQLTVTYLSLLSASLTTHRLTVSQNLDDLNANGGTSSDHSQTIPSRATAFSSAGDDAVLYKCANSLNRLAHDYTVLRTFVTSQPSTTNTKDTSRGTNQQSDTAMEVQQTLCLVLAFAIQRIAKSLSRLSSGKVPTQSKKQSNDDDTEMKEPGQSSSRIGATETDEEDVFDIDPLLIPLLGKLDRVMANGSDRTRMVIEGERLTRPKTFVEVFRSSSGLTLQYLCEYLQGQSDYEEEALIQLERGIYIVQQLLSRYIAFPIWIPQEFFVSRHPTPKDPSSISSTNQFGFSI